MDNLFKLFYCWQSDTPSSKGRYLIREALDQAATILADDESVRFRLDVDQDTQGEPGLCDIPSTILRKISQADAFIADMSIVARTDKGKDCPNPNVLFELGYAFEKIGPERIILVAQENPDEAVQQIFDVRHRRKPISYSFGVNDTQATVTQRLAKELAAAIKPVMKLGIRSHSTGDNAVQFGREELELKSLMAVDLIDCDRPVFSILFNPQRHVEKRWPGLTDLETFVRQNVARLSRGDDYPPSQRYTKRFGDGIQRCLRPTLGDDLGKAKRCHGKAKRCQEPGKAKRCQEPGEGKKVSGGRQKGVRNRLFDFWSGGRQKGVRGRQKGVRNRLFDFWSSLGADNDFETEFSGRRGRPCFIAERRASIDAATEGREFSVRLR